MALRSKPAYRRVTRSPVVIPLALSAVEGNPVASPAVSGRKETVANGGEGSAFHFVAPASCLPCLPRASRGPRRAGSFPLVGARFSASPGAFCGTGIPACAPLPAPLLPFWYSSQVLRGFSNASTRRPPKRVTTAKDKRSLGFAAVIGRITSAGRRVAPAQNSRFLPPAGRWQAAGGNEGPLRPEAWR
jgi:hypothetical protein